MRVVADCSCAGDPQCKTGVKLGKICCDSQCGKCGHEDCEGRPGGGNSCCAGTIRLAQKSCDIYNPPCIISDAAINASSTNSSTNTSVAAEDPFSPVGDGTWGQYCMGPPIDGQNDTAGVQASLNECRQLCLNSSDCAAFKFIRGLACVAGNDHIGSNSSTSNNGITSDNISMGWDVTATAWDVDELGEENQVSSNNVHTGEGDTGSGTGTCILTASCERIGHTVCVEKAGGIFSAQKKSIRGDPGCSRGIAYNEGINPGKVCCAASCGMCGGVGCAQRPGGESGCCTGDILQRGAICYESEAPCLVEPEKNSTSIYVLNHYNGSAGWALDVTGRYAMKADASIETTETWQRNTWNEQCIPIGDIKDRCNAKAECTGFVYYQGTSECAHLLTSSTMFSRNESIPQSIPGAVVSYVRLSTESNTVSTNSNATNGTADTGNNTGSNTFERFGDDGSGYERGDNISIEKSWVETDWNLMGNATMEDIKTRCEDREQCVGFIHNESSGIAHLLTSTEVHTKNEAVTSDGIISFVKIASEHSATNATSSGNATSSNSSGAAVGDYVYGEGVAATNDGFECMPTAGDGFTSVVNESWTGTLEEAEAKCDANLECAYLHDSNRDGIEWRACKSVTPAGADATTTAATKVKEQSAEPSEVAEETETTWIRAFGDEMKCNDESGTEVADLSACKALAEETVTCS